MPSAVWIVCIGSPHLCQRPPQPDGSRSTGTPAVESTDRADADTCTRILQGVVIRWSGVQKCVLNSSKCYRLFTRGRPPSQPQTVSCCRRRGLTCLLRSSRRGCRGRAARCYRIIRPGQQAMASYLGHRLVVDVDQFPRVGVDLQCAVEA